MLGLEVGFVDCERIVMRLFEGGLVWFGDLCRREVCHAL